MPVAKIPACQLLIHLLGTANLAPVGTSIITLLIVYLTAALVHAIHVANRTLLKMAKWDVLTDLFNRRDFDDLARLIHGMGKLRGSLKRDRYGHGRVCSASTIPKVMGLIPRDMALVCCPSWA